MENNTALSFSLPKMPKYDYVWFAKNDDGIKLKEDLAGYSKL